MNSFTIAVCILSCISLVHPDEEATPAKKFKFIEMDEITGMASTYEKLLNALIQPSITSPSQIMDQIKMVQSDMQQLQELLHIQYDDLISTLNSFSLLNDMKTMKDRFHQYSSYINYLYYKLTSWINSEKGDFVGNVTLLEFAKESTGEAEYQLPNYLWELTQLIAPRNHKRRGLLNLYSNYILKLNRNNEWCDNEQSLNDLIYKFYRYTLETLMKGHLVVLESYAIRRAFNEGNFTAKMRFSKNEYGKAAHSITRNLHDLANKGSTKLRRCDPSSHKKGETYIAMEKLFQGILVNKLNMNRAHNAKYSCYRYQDAEAWYNPHERIRADGDWKCHGLMYNCFESYATDICKPTMPNRRFDGFTAENPINHLGKLVPQNIGNLTNCRENKVWSYRDWYIPGYEDSLDLGLCGCICDDIKDPNTLRKFSADIVTTNYKENMVMTGVRLININNTIHINVQQGKLGSFGFINPGTIYWKIQNEVLKEHNNMNRVPITLTYRIRGITLDALQASPNQVLIGAKFILDADGNVVLSAIAANFDYATGKIDLHHPIDISYNSARFEIELDKPNVSTLSPKNVPGKEDHALIKFQTTDWLKDVAQTTVPYLDIQEVVTNPPTILRGIGLRYRSAPGFGGFISFELYSHDYLDLIRFNQI